MNINFYLLLVQDINNYLFHTVYINGYLLPIQNINDYFFSLLNYLDDVLEINIKDTLLLRNKTYIIYQHTKLNG